MQHNEVKSVRLEGKIDTLSANLSGQMNALAQEIKNYRDDVTKSESYNHETRWVLVALIVTCALGLGGILIATATYGDALFSRGMNVHDVIQAAVKETADQLKKPQ